MSHTKKLSSNDMPLSVKTQKKPTTTKTNLLDILGIDIKKSAKSQSLVIGKVQSGKTQVMIDYCERSKDLDFVTFYVVRNILADVDQLLPRIGKRFKVSEINQIVKKSVFTEKQEKKIQKQDILRLKSKIPNGLVIVGKMNKHDLTKFYYLARYLGFRFNIVIDEGDLITGDIKGTDKILKNIIALENSNHLLQVTATPVATILSGKINYYYKLEQDRSYVGVLHDRIKFHIVPAIETVSKSEKKAGVINPVNMENMSQILSQEKKICIALMISTTTVEEQKTQLTALLRRHRDYCGILFNNDGIIPYIDNQKGKPLSDISTAISYLVNEKKKSRIVIFAGYKASRGISFVDKDYRYHLTDLYIRGDKKVSGHCEELIQKLRILGKYPSEAAVYKGTEENKLNIWTTSEVQEEIYKCNTLIDLLTNKLVENTKSGNRIDSIEQVNEILHELELRLETAVPSIPLSRKEYDEMKTMEKVAEYSLDGKKTDIDIEYDEKADGFFLLNNEGQKHCNHEGFGCDSLKNKIVKSLEKYTGIKLPEQPHMLFNLYYPDCILEHYRDTINNLRIEYSRLTDSKEKTKKLSEIKEMIERNCNEFIDTKIFRNKKFNELLSKDPRYSQLISYIKTRIEEKSRRGEKLTSLLEFFDFTSYLNDDLNSMKARFRNYRTQIDEELFKTKKSIKEFPQKPPFDFSYGSKRFLTNIANPTEPCPLVWSIYVPHDFTFKKNTYKSIADPNQVLYWHNLKGEVFIKPINLAVQAEFQAKKAQRLQIKSRAEVSLPKISSLEIGDDIKAEFWYLHKYLLSKCASEINKSKEDKRKLRRYHEIRHIVLSQDPLLELIKRMEKVEPILYGKVIGDIGCGHGKIQKRFTDLTVMSFDHEKLEDHVKMANMEKLPVADNTFDILIYCLSLGWGCEKENNMNSYLEEAYRVGKHDCELKIICTLGEIDKIRELLTNDFISRISITYEEKIFGKFIKINCRIQKYIDTF